jgi:hypothetical protein
VKDNVFMSIDAHVKKYGPVSPGKHWKSAETWKQYSNRKSSDFFHGFLTSFQFFPAGNPRKSPEKVRKFSGWNTASISHHFPDVSCRIR